MPTTVEPRRPAFDRDTAMRLAATEYQRLVAQLRELVPEDWSRPTACPAWDVHRMVCHVIGNAEMSASHEERMRQVAAARSRGGLFIDALTAVQVDKHVDRTPAELVELLAAVAPRAVRGRTGVPADALDAVMPGQPVDDRGAQLEPWRFAYLNDVIWTRDTWIHRSDIAVATQRAMVLTSDHDGELVADMATEWAERHGEPCTLLLSGPAGGEWAFGGGARYELDAVEFCRILSGRGTGEGLLGTRIPF